MSKPGILSQPAESLHSPEFSWVQRGLAFTLLMVIHASVGALALQFETLEPSVSPVWPSSGIALAGLILLGWEMAPAIFLGTLIASVMSGVAPPLLVGVSLANLLEALAGYALLRFVWKFSPELRRIRDVLALLLLGGMVATSIGATVGTWTLHSTGQLVGHDVVETWMVWWIGDMLGVLVVGSALMVLGSRPRFHIFQKHYLELSAIGVILMAGSYMVFGPTSGSLRPVGYMVFACIVWSALRFEQLGAVLAGACASMMAVGATLRNIELSTSVPLIEHLAQLQGSIAVMIIAGLFMAALMSERNDAIDDARRTEFTMRSANRAANLGAWSLDVTSGEVTWLEEVPALRVLGSLTSTQWMKRIHADDYDRVNAVLAEASCHLTDFECEYRVNMPLGGHIWLLTRGSFLAGEKPLRAVGVSIDITERKRAEEELRGREAELRTIAEAIPQLVWSTMADGSLDYCNTRACEYAGCTQEELLGMAWGDVVHPDDMVSARGRWTRSIEFGDVYECECRLRRGRDQAYRWFLARGVPLHDAEGRVLKWFGTCTDIHDQKQHEEVLRRTEKLAATGRLAASIAHEINNPLAAVSNLLFLLKRDPTLLPAARDYVKLADAELSRVTHIARQTLMFYRESSVPIPMNITEVLDGVLDLYGQKLAQAKVTVERRYLSRLTIKTVPGEIRQILSNLLVNAVEAMPSGGAIVVRVRDGYDWRNSQVRGVRICVSDNGPGIAQQHLRDIFEPFYSTKGDKGTGLGLWVTQGLITKNGGTSHVRSRMSGAKTGTVFSVFLPLEMLEEEVREKSATA